MTETRKLFLFVATISLTFGLAWPDPQLAGGRTPFPQDYIVLTADESTHQSQVQSQQDASESAKMGEQSGIQSGDEAATPENETKKVDQPAGQNPTSSD
jgi:hypothetical protein